VLCSDDESTQGRNASYLFLISHNSLSLQRLQSIRIQPIRSTYKMKSVHVCPLFLTLVPSLLAASYISPCKLSQTCNKHAPSLLLLHAKNNDDEKDGGGLTYSSPITSFLGRFLPSKEEAGVVSLDEATFSGRKKLSIDDMVSALDQGLREREWFVTGDVIPDLFAEDFTFKDPDVELQGIEAYANGVKRLFDQETSRAEVIECSLNQDATRDANEERDVNDVVQVIRVEWRLSGNVNIGPLQGLRIKPYICISDMHVREADGLIIYQEDTFDIPGYDILLSAFFPWLPFLAPEAPPVSEILKSR